MALKKQNLGRVPLRSRDEERSDENKLRRKIDRAKKSGGITEEQYRSLTSAGEEDGHLFDAWEQAVQNLGRTPLRSKDPESRDEDNLRRQIDHAKKIGGITEEKYRLLIRKRPQLEDVPLSQQVEDLLSELEAFKAEHGKYPTTNKPGVPGGKLYAKRARFLKKQDLTTAQIEALKNTQCFQRQMLDTYAERLSCLSERQQEE